MSIRAMERAPRTAFGVGLLGCLALVLGGGCAAAPQMEPMVYAAQEAPATAPTEATTQPVGTEPATSPATEPVSAVPPPRAAQRTYNGGVYGEVVPARDIDRLPLRFGLTGSYMYAPVHGYVQIPSGGKIGTSSSKHPTLRQMGVENTNIGDGELTIGVGDYGEFFLGAQYIHESGSSTIERNLTTHGITFPKGTHINGDIQLDWYRVGYRYPIPLNFTPEGRTDLTFTPWVDAVFWDFSYDVSAGSVGDASRSFTKPGVQVGGDLVWRPGGGPFSLEAGVGSFPRVSSLATISTERLIARYHFYRWRRFDFSAHVGLEFEQQDFKDSQRLSNHISADFGPMLVTGLSVGF